MSVLFTGLLFLLGADKNILPEQLENALCYAKRALGYASIILFIYLFFWLI